MVLYSEGSHSIHWVTISRHREKEESGERRRDGNVGRTEKPRQVGEEREGETEGGEGLEEEKVGIQEMDFCFVVFCFLEKLERYS